MNIPTDPKKIKARIRSYEQSFTKNIRSFGTIDDGGGKRFLLGPLYVLMGDNEGALITYKWYSDFFYTDVPNGINCLMWSLALYRDGQTGAAKDKLLETHLNNLYILYALFDEPFESIQEWDNEYYHAINPDLATFFDVWTTEEKEWAKELRDSKEFEKAYTRVLDIEKALLTEPVGPKRTTLVELRSAILDSDLRPEPDIYAPPPCPGSS